MALQPAELAVQIYGVNSCSPDYPVVGYFCDTKGLEIIEGSS